MRGGINLYGYAGGDPVNRHDPFGLADCDRNLPEAERRECERNEAAAEAERAKARAAAAQVCSEDLVQFGASFLTSFFQIGALKALRRLGSLATSEAAWANSQVTNGAIASFSFAPSATAINHELNRGGGTPNPFDGTAGEMYDLFSGLGPIGAGLKLGEAVNSCLAAW